MSLSFRGDDEGGLGLTLSDNRFLELENERLKKENSKLKEQNWVMLEALKRIGNLRTPSKDERRMPSHEDFDIVEEAIKQAEAK